jgi:small subunit ribosomal protein S16
MVRIRMQRLGRRNRPFYRIAVAEKNTRRNGPVIEQLGFYDPIAKDPAKQLKLDHERVKFWIAKGAQPSDTCRDFFGKLGLIDVKAWEADRKADRDALQTRLAKKAAEAAEKPAEKKA